MSGSMFDMVEYSFSRVETGEIHKTSRTIKKFTNEMFDAVIKILL